MDIDELICLFEKINKYRVCVCCKRHQRNRPTDFLYVDKTDSDVLTDVRCPCPCRHICRIVFSNPRMPCEG
jgi:hypothetical protein